MQHNKIYSPSEKELIKQLESKDLEALSQLYDRYTPVLYGVIRRMVKDEEIAQQVLQESFEHIWSSMPLFKKEVKTFSAWLISIARDLALVKVRERFSQQDGNLDRQQENESHYSPGESKQPEVSHSPERSAKFPAQQCVLDLLYFDGYTPMQVAQMLNIPLESLKKMVRAEIKAIRNQVP